MSLRCVVLRSSFRRCCSSEASGSEITFNNTNKKVIIPARTRPSNVKLFNKHKYSSPSTGKSLTHLAWFPGDIASIANVPLVPSPNCSLPTYNFDDADHIEAFYPSYSLIIDKTRSASDRMRLEAWKKKQIELYGLEKFEKMSQDRMNLGTKLHQLCYDYMQNKDTIEWSEVSSKLKPYWQSAKRVIDQVDQLKLSEIKLNHPLLCYKGVFDGIVSYKDKLVLLEIKTSEKLKPTLDLAYEYPLQVAAYAGLINYNLHLNLTITTGLVLVCYPNENEPATLLHVDEVTMKNYWKKWLKRLKCFWLAEDNVLVL